MSPSAAGPSGQLHRRSNSSLNNEDESSGEDDIGLAGDRGVLEDDPLSSGLAEPISFKRKPRQSKSRFSLSNILSGDGSGSNSPSRTPNRVRTLRDTPSRHGSPIGPYRDASDAGRADAKDGSTLDWYIEGPGRRVGYEDLTAIDWIFEYTKERIRKRVLHSNAHGVAGQIRQLLDASHVWIVLVLTGVAVGVLAASMDVASDWLGDLKTGYCKRGNGGGKFYLNKGFCCWGHEEWSQCQDWTPWRTAFHAKSGFAGYSVEYIMFTILSVLFAASASILVKNYAPYAKHSGIPEIKTVLGGFVIRHYMGAWTLLIKSLGLCLAVASGMWLGKEGPLVHVACCCANLIMKPFENLRGNEARRREVLSAAAAAGISVAFGSPIGGVLFSLEQLSYYFPDKTMWQSFVCAMIAAVTLQAFNPFRTGKIVLFQVTYSDGWHGFELIPYILLGVLGGIYGGAFTKLNMRIAKWRKDSNPLKSPVIEVTIVAFISAVLNFPNMFMRAQSSELVYALFAECSTVVDDQFGLCKTGKASLGVIALLLVAAGLGFILALLTFGLEIPAGIILPTVAIGALYGRALGIAMEMLQEAYPAAWLFNTCEPDTACITPGTYAIIGAASALGGVTRMTVSIVVIMFELTGALTYVLPIMIAVMLSKWIGDAFGKKGIYEMWIRFKEYPFLDNKDDTPAPDVPVAQVMTKVEDLNILSATGHTIESLRNLLKTSPFRGFPVVSSIAEPVLLGYISRIELTFALDTSSSPMGRNLPPSTQAYFSHQPMHDPIETLDLRPWMDQTPITLNSQCTFQLTVDMFQKLGLRYVLFVKRGQLQGLLTKKDVWFVLNGVEDSSAERIGSGLMREDGGEEDQEGLLGSFHPSSP